MPSRVSGYVDMCAIRIANTAGRFTWAKPTMMIHTSLLKNVGQGQILIFQIYFQSLKWLSGKQWKLRFATFWIHHVVFFLSVTFFIILVIFHFLIWVYLIPEYTLYLSIPYTWVYLLSVQFSFCWQFTHILHGDSVPWATTILTKQILE